MATAPALMIGAAEELTRSYQRRFSIWSREWTRPFKWYCRRLKSKVMGIQCYYKQRLIQSSSTCRLLVGASLYLTRLRSRDGCLPIIRRMIDGCEKSKGGRCKKIATIIMTVKAIWVFRNNSYAWRRTNGNEILELLWYVDALREHVGSATH